GRSRTQTAGSLRRHGARPPAPGAHLLRPGRRPAGAGDRGGDAARVRDPAAPRVDRAPARGAGADARGDPRPPAPRRGSL
ncbi:MAG: hypothetical protein AVDCRST_MAG30-1678, partial [uncultured Solirubrobacteraceae bacterium]